MRPVAIVGSGIMGRGIALVLSTSGREVRVFDQSAQALQDALPAVRRLAERSVAKGQLSEQDAQDAVSRISTAASLADVVRSADLVIEAVPEDIDLKVALMAELDRLADEDAILASNTSSLSITRMAAATTRPSRVIGMHFFNPAHLMPLVEVVRGMVTSDAVVEDIRRTCRSIGKEPIVVRDRPGFATSRLSAALGNEAFYMFMEGVASPEEIDTAARLGFGFPMGPFELGDLIGLDTRLNVLRGLHASLGERFRPCPLLVSYVEAGHLGRKTGRGVYVYDESDEAADV